MDAVERAQQLLNVKRSELPELARDYSYQLCGEHGWCIEVMLTAFAYYAQCVEGLLCKDPAYYPSPTAKQWFQTRGYSNTKPLFSDHSQWIADVEELRRENRELKLALSNARTNAKLLDKVTTREFATRCGITATQLSQWTDHMPTRRPDLID